MLTSTASYQEPSKRLFSLFCIAILFVTGFLNPLNTLASSSQQYCSDEFKSHNKKALEGDSQAQAALASSYYNGICVAKDELKAIKWYRKSYGSGHTIAGEALSKILLNKESLSYSPTEAISILKANAEKGSKESQVTLGNLYAEGQLLKQNYKKAFELWSAALPNRAAKYNLALFYDQGLFVQKDTSNALALLMEAAKAGELNAQRELCVSYVQGNGFGVSKDMKKAFPYCYEAANLGDREAANFLSIIYMTDGDDKRAIDWLTIAADSGLVHSQYALGKIYLIGTKNVSKDRKRAEKYLQMAADQGSVEAKEKLFSLYAEGGKK